MRSFVDLRIRRGGGYVQHVGVSGWVEGGGGRVGVGGRVGGGVDW